MTIHALVAKLRRTVASRRIAIRAALALPVVLVVLVFVARLAGAGTTTAAALCALAMIGLLAWRTWRETDTTWLARRLDALDPRMQDSAALLLADARDLAPLAALQRRRLEQRFVEWSPDLRPAWPRRTLAIAWAAALAVLLVGRFWTPALSPDARHLAVEASDAATSRLLQARIDIVPPAYTGLAARVANTLDVEASAGAQLTWRLRFAPEPRAAALVLHDGRRVALDHVEGAWRASLTLAESALYRIELADDSTFGGDLYRLDAIADRAPDIRVLEPERTLSLLTSGQTTWTLVFEASDDYAIMDAQLAVELAQASGDSVQVKAQTIALAGTSLDGQRHLRYRHTVDLAALGFTEGDDLIVRVLVRDNREPEANHARSASFILRWPVQAASDTADLEGVVQRTLPAYFRSQRQIIIDSEALVAERGTLAATRFLDRSDAIGVDQKILRLRYGQFLGEESETVDQRGADERHDDHDHAAAGEAPAAFGNAGDVLAEYGHTHDSAEAATLLDPQTRAILKSALAEMWQAELHLRQGDPEAALPYEHRALGFIKQVQQASRIYLARVGLELPVPDETRRLTGDREGVDDPPGTLASAPQAARPIIALWQALGGAGAPDWKVARRWLDARQAGRGDVLDVIAALDRAQREPGCAECQDALRTRLWSLLPMPAAASALRPAADAAGRAWLDALRDASVQEPR